MPLLLEFTPLEFETMFWECFELAKIELEFTPLEFETTDFLNPEYMQQRIRIYSVGVWNNLDLLIDFANGKLEFTPLEFETIFTKQR